MLCRHDSKIGQYEVGKDGNINDKVLCSVVFSYLHCRVAVVAAWTIALYRILDRYRGGR